MPESLDFNSSNGLPLSPVLRWAGAKRLLLPRLTHFLPSKFGRYYEPMVGSGALFFMLRPFRAVIGDINEELMSFYQVLRQAPRLLHEAVRRLPPNKATYYSVRASSPRSKLGRAARFYYLIRLSWNGLYRVNRQGQFNVPYSGRKPKELMSLQSALQVAKALRGATLLTGDVEDTIAGVRAGDLVYFDPPYPKGASNGNGFSRYSRYGFGISDHTRVARHASMLADRGVHVLVTEAARKELLKLYSSSFHTTLVRNPSLIAGGREHRRDAYEAILTSYEV